MKLSKSLTTVTTFSKTLAFILFISLPFLGFYLGIQYQKFVTPSSGHIQFNYLNKNEPTATISEKPQLKACTMEAKLCSDGSTVGRTG